MKEKYHPTLETEEVKFYAKGNDRGMIVGKKEITFQNFKKGTIRKRKIMTERYSNFQKFKDICFETDKNLQHKEKPLTDFQIAMEAQNKRVKENLYKYRTPEVVIFRETPLNLDTIHKECQGIELPHEEVIKDFGNSRLWNKEVKSREEKKG